jgi:putative ABC transport system substrate-binding protein
VRSVYTHRVAISNRRLIACDEKGVTFKWKDYRIEGPERYEPPSPRRKHHRYVAGGCGIARQMCRTVPRHAPIRAGRCSCERSWPLLEQFELAAKTSGIEIGTVMVRAIDEIDAAFAAMKSEGADAVVVQGSLASKNTAELALKHRLPAATVPRSFAEVGGLMSYGADGPHAFQRGAVFVAKILQGGKPADMPVEQPTKCELVINLKTAKALGLTISESFLLRADALIE